MTKREAAIVSAYTRILIGKFQDMHEYIEEIMHRPVWTHEMANKETVNKIKAAAKKDFCSINVT